MTRRSLTLAAGLCIFITIAVASTSYSWSDDWAVAADFELHLDAEGFRFPSAIAVVPNPGSDPRDPLYFVTELRGTVKVVTNDRTVLTFASNVANTGQRQELPSQEGETGLAGIALDPEHGYVFVSFAYLGENNILRNNIVRYTTKPRTFGVKPEASLAFTEIFKPFQTDISHQIGPMVVDGGALYVSVGDAEQPATSQQLDNPGGKILRMTLDGKSLPDNPFYARDDPKHIRSYVWSLGLRNPFSLTAAQGGIFLMDNGPGVDRFAEVHRGWNYGYDGTDWSMGVSSQYTFSPSVGPAQLAFIGDETEHRGPLRGHFVVALAGSPLGPPGPSSDGSKSIVHFKYNFHRSKVISVPQPLVQHRGDHKQVLAALAVHEEALFFAPLLPTTDGGRSPVFRLEHKPGHRHEHVVGENMTPAALMNMKGCISCHDARLGEVVGPPLDRTLGNRLAARLNSDEYEKQVIEVDSLTDELHTKFDAARREVLQAHGHRRVRIWMRYRLLEPRFDQITSAMPNLGLTDEEADALVAYLLPPENRASLFEKLLAASRSARYRYGATGLAIGFLLGLSVAAAIHRYSHKSRA